MKSLIISPHTLFPFEEAVSGVLKRFLTFVRAIARISTSVEFLCIAPLKGTQTHPINCRLQEILSAYCNLPTAAFILPTRRRTETFWNHYISGLASVTEQPLFYSYCGPEQAEAVGQHLDRVQDLVFVFRLAAMAAVLRSGREPRRMFFDLDDVEHKVLLRSSLKAPLWPGKLAYCGHVPAIWQAERRGAALSRATFVCSEKDRRHLRYLGFGSRVTVIPNAIAIPKNVPAGLELLPTLLFIGYYPSPANAVAAERLIQRIWPRIRRAAPGARLIMAGQHPESLPSFGRRPEGVTFTGLVSDVAALYARSRVVVCPVTMGGGTRVKLVEAASYAKPIVSTRIGAEGLSFEDGKEILLCDDDVAFADCCARLLKDDSLCASLGAAARAKAAALYNVESAEQRIIETVKSAI